MAPLADFAGVPKHLVVTAYQSANGLVNLFTPTFAVVAGGLAIGRVTLNIWWRFVLPLRADARGLVHGRPLHRSGHRPVTAAAGMAACTSTRRR